MNSYLFSYGTLQKEQVQIELFGRIVTGSADILSGYKADIIEIKDEAFLSTGAVEHQLIALPSANKNDCIKGTVLELTEEELAIADKYEPDNYKRVEVQLGSGKKAWLYSAKSL
jgi:gamma-glutamylcyclotransferase (GGCT)/AIG2-like uncharacterized protein YtfP